MGRAVIYCRISDDRSGRRAGVRRQEEDCRALTKRKRWKVAGVYVDNDVSAWKARRRPEYRRMLDDITAGLVDAVVVWHQDRLVRHPKELEEFFEICDAAGVRDMATVTGDIDLGTDDGRFHARILGAVARKESDDKSRRIRRKMEELAKDGRGKGGGTRPLGYERDRVTINKSEAELIREAARRVVAGESLRSVCFDWTRRGVQTVTGVNWSTTVLRRVLTAPRTAGLREHQGVVVAEAEWPGILDRGTHARLSALLLDPVRRKNIGGSARKYLLTGFAHCDLCGAKLVARPRADQRRCYVCATGPGFHGCGKIRSLAEPLEAFVRESIFEALNGGSLDKALTLARGQESSDGQLLQSLRDDEASLEQLAQDHYAHSLISRSEFLAARRAIESRMDRTRNDLSRLEGGRVLADIPTGQRALRTAWDDRGLDWRRALVEATLERIVLGSAIRGRNFFEDSRVALVWRR